MGVVWGLRGWGETHCWGKPMGISKVCNYVGNWLGSNNKLLIRLLQLRTNRAEKTKTQAHKHHDHRPCQPSNYPATKVSWVGLGWVGRLVAGKPEIEAICGRSSACTRKNWCLIVLFIIPWFSFRNRIILIFSNKYFHFNFVPDSLIYFSECFWKHPFGEFSSPKPPLTSVVCLHNLHNGGGMGRGGVAGPQ